MKKKSTPVVMKEKNKNKIIIKSSSIKTRDVVHFDHILHRSGTGAHKSQKTYSRKVKYKREDVSFFCYYTAMQCKRGRSALTSLLV